MHPISLMIIGQAAAEDPSWLKGAISIPFPIVGAIVGLAVMGALIYYARRASRSRDERLSDEEQSLR